nr:hypothetical protein [Geminicoccus flavidas]
MVAATIPVRRTIGLPVPWPHQQRRILGGQSFDMRTHHLEDHFGRLHPAVGTLRLPGGCGQNLLDVARTQQRVGLQHQRHDAAHDRCREGGTALDDVFAIGIFTVRWHPVRRKHVLARRRHQKAGARIGEPGRPPIPVDGRH